jgi:hypothetical protein
MKSPIPHWRVLRNAGRGQIIALQILAIAWVLVVGGVYFINAEPSAAEAVRRTGLSTRVVDAIRAPFSRPYVF